jgi:hypothetical protein
MRPFVIESMFWRSAANALLRSIGIARAIPYRVLVRAERVWLRDAGTCDRTLFGLYATKFVIASTESDASAAALEAVRAEVLAVAGDPKDAILFDVETVDVGPGIVWRQGRGFTLFPLKENTSSEMDR